VGDLDAEFDYRCISCEVINIDYQSRMKIWN
jgi:hypothetical protein